MCYAIVMLYCSSSLVLCMSLVWQFFGGKKVSNGIPCISLPAKFFYTNTAIITPHRDSFNMYFSFKCTCAASVYQASYMRKRNYIFQHVILGKHLCVPGQGKCLLAHKAHTKVTYKYHRKKGMCFLSQQINLQETIKLFKSMDLCYGKRITF